MEAVVVVHVASPLLLGEISNCLARSSNSETALKESFVLLRGDCSVERLVAEKGMRIRISFL
jgi:hypothetical protein